MMKTFLVGTVKGRIDATGQFLGIENVGLLEGAEDTGIRDLCDLLAFDVFFSLPTVLTDHFSESDRLF